MIEHYTVTHHEHVSRKSFEELVAAFEAAVGNADDGKLTHRMPALKSVAEWEALCESLFGPSGFMHVLTFDHGLWASLYGTPTKMKQYTYGNPQIAHTMFSHDRRVGFHVPLRAMIYETASGEVRMGYDLPSTLMRGLHNDAIDAAAGKLDEKLVAFMTELTGAAA